MKKLKLGGVKLVAKRSCSSLGLVGGGHKQAAYAHEEGGFKGTQSNEAAQCLNIALYEGVIPKIPSVLRINKSLFWQAKAKCTEA